MKQLLNISIILVIAGLVVAGCRKEKALTPTTEKENVYGPHTLPQGNHPYDNDIQVLYNKYNTLFLYKYKPEDLYYNFDYWRGGEYDPVANKTTRTGLFDIPAGEAWVGKQLDLLKEIWLNYYPDSLLRKGLPQKVFLVDSFFYAWAGPGKPAENWPELYNIFTGGDFIVATWEGSRMEAITPEEKYTYKSELNTAFLKKARELNAVRRLSAFTSLTDYSQINSTNYKQLGIIESGVFTPDDDWDSYMKTIVSNSYTKLTSPGGALHASWDVNGVIRKKYDIVIGYFQSAFGVDLQAIGNAGS